jgi:hypothetical protein
MKKKVWDVDWIPLVQEESCGELFWTALELRVSQKAWNFVTVWTTLSQALLRGINKGIFVLLPVRSTGIPPLRRRSGRDVGEKTES